MELQKISQVVEHYGISSRTLRYYEEIGLLQSTRPEYKAQRYYDEKALERLKQILILRKLQIPIKEILQIYEKGEAVELREIIDEFVGRMVHNGITKISGITLLYEETQEIIDHTRSKDALPSLQEINRISRENLKLRDVNFIRLPPMHMLTSLTREGRYEDIEKARIEFRDFDIIPTPGMRDSFYVKKHGGEWLLMSRVPEGFQNHTIYTETIFKGGLFALTTSFMEEADDISNLLKEWIRCSEMFELDAESNGQWRCEEMVEELFPWDIAQRLNRYQQDIFIPVRMKKEK